jgi:hypothetical protein
VKFDTLFETYFNTAKQVVGKPTTRQQSARMGATPWRQGSQNLVPDRDRVDPTLNPKIEKLRGSNTDAKIPVSDRDLEYIRSTYDIKNITTDSPRMLGKTGIKMYWDNTINSFVLQRV